ALNNIGSGNTAIGNSALYSNTTGSNNTAIGKNALVSNTTGSNNTAIGNSALLLNTTASNNTAIGNSALLLNTTGTDNFAAGASALYNNTTASNNIAIGSSTLYHNTTGTSNIALGFQALYSNTTASNNIAIGNTALHADTTGPNNIAIGNDALYNNTGYDNIALGTESLYPNTGNYNTALGYYALSGNTSGGNNSAFGAQALTGNKTGSANAAFGHSALYSNTSGTDNTAFGYNTLYNNITGYDNTMLGDIENTGGNNITTGYNNIALGFNAGLGTTTSSSNFLNIGNTFFGSLVATSTSTSLPTNFANASFAVATSSTLGSDTFAVQNSSTNNHVASFYSNAGSSLLTVLDNGNVGIGTTSPATTLSVAGSGLFSGGATLGGNVNVSGLGSTISVPRTVGITPFAANNAARFTFGDADNTIQNEYGGRMQWVSYWGAEIHGNNEGVHTFTTGGKNDAALSVFGPSGNTAPILQLLNNAGTSTDLTVTGGGNLGVGTTSPATLLEVGGSTNNVTFDGYQNCSGFTSNANGVLACTASDERLKQDIVPLDSADGLAAIDALNPVSFYWKPETGRGPVQQYGVIAQQVQNVFPNLVTVTNPTPLTPDGTLTVNYDGFIAPMLRGIQQLDERTKFIQNAASSTVFSVAATGDVSIGTTTASGGNLAVAGTVSASSFETAQAPATSFTFGSTTLSAQIPFSVLTLGGTVDIYKLATYNLSGVAALAAAINAQNMRITSLEARVAALESGAVAAASDSPLTLSTTSLVSALNSVGVFIKNGLTQFGTLIADQFVAATNSAGTSSAGTVNILSGNTVAQVNNAYVLPTTKVFVTFNSPLTGTWYVADKQAGSFRVVLSAPQTSDVSFDYFLVQTEGQIATSTAAVATGPSVILSNSSTTQTPITTTTTVIISSVPSVPTTTTSSTSSATSTTTTNTIATSTPITTTATTTSSSSAVATSTPITTATATPTITSTSTPPTTTSTPTDTTPPVVTLNGSAAMQLTVGSTFTDPGATATDKVDGNLTSKIVVTGSVNTATAGLYTLTYSVTDAAGNTGSASRAVSVVAPAPAPTTTTTASTTAP
ncbi:DUF5011 domain-containing protein, partial [Candidatus Parcubacteria bacterium]|nr:DUF5011 domain-containing protein [Candidatus Parcubacteria bacterium]